MSQHQFTACTEHGPREIVTGYLPLTQNFFVQIYAPHAPQPLQQVQRLGEPGNVESFLRRQGVDVPTALLDALDNECTQARRFGAQRQPQRIHFY